MTRYKSPMHRPIPSWQLRCAGIAALSLSTLLGCRDKPAPAPHVQAGAAALGYVTAGASALTAGSEAIDASQPPFVPPGDAGSRMEGPWLCQEDATCDDHVACNGLERCVDGLCREASERLCPSEHPCNPKLDTCECTRPDMDGDGWNAVVCGGSDCDDGAKSIHPMGTERCDERGVDEDCDPRTFYGANDGNKDGDNAIDVRCFNLDLKTGEPYIDPATGATSKGTDCNDVSPVVYPGNTETCDYVDNDCDGVIDETLNPDGTGTGIQGAMWNDYYRDADHDGHIDRRLPPVRACSFDQREHYLDKGAPDDCNDDDATIYYGAPELCDRKDNNCNGLYDDADPDIEKKFSPPTVTRCVTGGWVITTCPADRGWCDTKTIDQGCDTDFTRLSSCRHCVTSCRFSCGTGGCDEIEKLSAGEHHTCAVTSEHRVACWGRGGDGRLGNDSTNAVYVPTLVTGLSDVRDVVAGEAHTCAIVGAEGFVYCWGNNAFGQVGNIDAGQFTAVPVAVRGGSTGTPQLQGAVTLAVGEKHSCAALKSGRVACWGELSGGLLGDRAGADASGVGAPRWVIHPMPVAGATTPTFGKVSDAKAVVTGAAHSCLLTAHGNVECWGDNTYGQLGLGMSTSTSSSVQSSDHAEPLSQLHDVSQIAAGTGHTCVVRDGSVSCWGLNNAGQLGHPSDERDSVPTPVAGLSGVAEVAAGVDFTCARTGAGAVYCWGSNAQAALGSATLAQSDAPLKIEIEAVTAITAKEHVCAQTENRQGVCWGFNAYGQLGNGTSSLTARAEITTIKALAGSRQ